MSNTWNLLDALDDEDLTRRFWREDDDYPFDAQDVEEWAGDDDEFDADWYNQEKGWKDEEFENDKDGEWD